MTTVPPPAPPPPLPPSAEPPSWPPPPPPGPPARPQLRRSRTDKVLGGVSGGLAEYSGVDALLWRVGFVALALAGGTGVAVYLLLWLLMPVGPVTYSSGYPAHPATPAERRVRPPAGPRSPVPGITIAALLIAVGLIALVDRVLGWDVAPVAYFGSALLVIGIGLVAAAFVGGRTARGGLIALGIVLSLATVTAASEPWRGIGGENGIGDQTYWEYDADMVQPSYSCGIGDCTLDLSGIDDLGDLDEAITTRLDAGVGDVRVILPRSADVRVTVDSGMGDVRIFGDDDRDGGFYPGVGGSSWADDGEAEFDLTINAGIGDVEVSRA
ncbi:PspC domain-containing protein [Blastococcus sp. PRF04-17]|uniref:PspC domain-containing protein n=1 Tax=Blastococcus sp. PRF04-17 TaxID=2933797 RepID=UPI001FF23F8F|nr:PspC domain-containing protein [Blastococcus sp. PRF04-17]UOY01106.1 PspC domain-containing protein [Blastococcus sp. PRF04-17]